jgi:hypothetical protein
MPPQRFGKEKASNRPAHCKIANICHFDDQKQPVANCKYAPNWQTSAGCESKKKMAPQVAGPSPLREKLVEG